MGPIGGSAHSHLGGRRSSLRACRIRVDSPDHQRPARQEAVAEVGLADDWPVDRRGAVGVNGRVLVLTLVNLTLAYAIVSSAIAQG